MERLKFGWITLFYMSLVIIGHLDAQSSKTYEYSRQTEGGKKIVVYTSLCSLNKNKKTVEKTNPIVTALKSLRD